MRRREAHFRRYGGGSGDAKNSGTLKMRRREARYRRYGSGSGDAKNSGRLKCEDLKLRVHISVAEAVAVTPKIGEH